MENKACFGKIKRRGWNRSCRGYFDPGGSDWAGNHFQITAYQSGAEYLSEDCQRKFRDLTGEVTVYLSLIFILLLAFIGSMIESASIQMAKNYRRADTNRAMECVFAEYQKELLEEYDIFALEASYETGQYDERSVTDRLGYYGDGSADHEIQRIQFLTDDGCSAFCDQVTVYMEQKYGIDIVENKLGLSSIWEQQEDKADSYAREEQEQQDYLDTLLSENESELPEDGNPIAYVSKLKQMSILDLVMPKDRTVSEKQVDETRLLAFRERNTGYGEFSDVAAGNGRVSTLLFGEYLLEHFTMFTETEGTGVLDYELEYILSGRGSDRENLENVVKKLLLLRFVPNYIYIQTDTEMKAEAEATALTLCSLLAVPAITEAAAQGILFAWAYGESIMDLRSLLQGSRVPMVKTKESWQLQLSGLLTLGTQEDRKEGQDVSSGLSYQDYLRMLLFLEKQDQIALRTLGMIEQNLCNVYGQSYFRADLCISRIEIQSVCSLRRGITYQYKTYYGYE